MKAAIVSVVIPTHRRPEALQRALASLERQHLSQGDYEVVVVDDGAHLSHDPPRGTTYRLRYLPLEPSGATVARNRGAQVSQGRVLVFMDDDVTMGPGALAALVEVCLGQDRVLALGTLAEVAPSPRGAFARLYRREPSGGEDVEVPCVYCNTQLLALRREDFFALGMLEDPTGGWPNWDDVAFGYRAHRAGYRLLRVGRARGVHWDASLDTWQAACQRWERAAYSAVALFERHPELLPMLPMFTDKGPPNWHQDAPRLILRKALRSAASTGPIRWGLEHAAVGLEAAGAPDALLRILYRWIVGAYIYRGFRRGLKDRGLHLSGSFQRAA